MRRLIFIVLVMFPALAHAAPIPRTIIAFYNSAEESTPRTTQLHRFLEMPLNHLGYDVVYHDIRAPLPALGPEVHGIVIWFNSGTEVPDANAYLDWLDAAVAQGRRLVVMENSGIGDKYRRDDAVMAKLNHVLGRIGVQDTNLWQSLTYQTRIAYTDHDMIGFERDYESTLPAYTDTRATNGAVSHLRLANGTGEDEAVSDLVITGAQGGYVSEGYAIFHIVEEGESKIHQWYINPFEFLRQALGADALPKPDISTLDGRRVFYSHIDGDGWNNISEIPAYQKTRTISAEVIRKEILSAYPDFAFNVGVITADIEPECYGTPGSADVARAMFTLPNVFPSSHTHSHPLYWRFFAHYSAAREKPFLPNYPPRLAEQSSLIQTMMGKVKNAWDAATAAPTNYAVPPLGAYDPSEEEALRKYYKVPRSYACAPFDLHREIGGSVDLLNTLTPANKKVKLIQWSGDTSPFEAALAQAREAGVYNLNGGDSRFDTEYPSYASVAPTGMKVGHEQQIYSSNSNENTYTNLWTDRFFGFRFLQTTVQNTETPMRVRPFNLYFHTYSGQKPPSLNAIKDNLNFARAQDIIPITASEFAGIANGFYTAQFLPLGPQRWQISERGALNTIRFDHATLRSVDFTTSAGVVGQRWFQGSLYVALDPDVSEPVISLKPLEIIGSYPLAATPYLIASRWQIKGLQIANDSLTFIGQGFGRSAMQWRVPRDGPYRVGFTRNGQELKHIELPSAQGILTIDVDDIAADEPLTITIAMTNPS